jgi:cytochrome P450
MKTHDVTFAQRPYFLVSDIISYNSTNIAFSPFGDYWRQVRKICILELLRAKRVQSFQAIREEEVSNLISSINYNAGLPINLTKLLYTISFDSTSRASFGKKSKDHEAFKSVMEEIMEVSKSFIISDIFLSIKLLHLISGTRQKLKILHQKADQILESIINEDRAREAPSNEIEADDLVHVLLNLLGHGKLEFPLTTDHIKSVNLVSTYTIYANLCDFIC